MISMVIPTRNRAHTLRLVAPSYFAQEMVSEIIFVSDAGDDDSEAVLRDVARLHPEVAFRFLRNETRQGASQSRNIGIAETNHPFVLFCDDDEYLEPGYASVCLKKLLAYRAAAVSGRRVYMQTGETQAQALERFGTGMRNTAPFRPMLCEYVNGARFDGDIRLPFTNAIILTRRELLLQHPFDGHYARGNGYREETDYQMNLFVNGHDIFVTNAVHSVHLPMSQVRTGGQRTSKLKRLYWSIYYTRYFFDKYYDAYARRMNLQAPRWLALLAFSIFAVYRDTLRPPLHAIAMQALRMRQGSQPRPAAF
ncbi:MAG: epsH 3 [Rhodocyclales bacterium]|nr:epsH 3 [Rhodocyclales bacterium]